MFVTLSGVSYFLTDFLYEPRNTFQKVRERTTTMIYHFNYHEFKKAQRTSLAPVQGLRIASVIHAFACLHPPARKAVGFLLFLFPHARKQPSPVLGFRSIFDNAVHK